MTEVQSVLASGAEQVPAWVYWLGAFAATASGAGGVHVAHRRQGRRRRCDPDLQCVVHANEVAAEKIVAAIREEGSKTRTILGQHTSALGKLEGGIGALVVHRGGRD